jgi:hypothetical protein
MTLCVNLTPIKWLDCPSKCRSFFQSYAPSNISRNKPKWCKPQPERQWRTFEERKMPLDQVPAKKTPEPTLPSNKEPSVYNFKPSQGSHATASDSHISLERYSARGSILSEGASKTGKSSVATLKIAECPQSEFLKILEQCNLYAACLASFSTATPPSVSDPCFSYCLAALRSVLNYFFRCRLC